MRRFVGILVFVVLAQFTVKAQEQMQVPKFELFGGYQFMHAGSFDGEGDSANTNDYTGSATFNFSKRLGVAADFSDNYRLEHAKLPSSSEIGLAHVHIYTYTFGPVVHLASHKHFSIFAHALFGGAAVRPTACVIFSGSRMNADQEM